MKIAHSAADRGIKWFMHRGADEPGRLWSAAGKRVHAGGNGCSGFGPDHQEHL